MKPWFEKEADIIKFPKPKAKVIRMPTVQEYPDFITGVKDLQAKQKDGTISQETYNKLYSDLIHRFMKKESFETPWFIREAPADTGIMGLPQAQQLKIDVEKAVANLDIKDDESIKLLNKLYQTLNKTSINDRVFNVLSKDPDAKDNVLKAMGEVFLNVESSWGEKNQFLDQYAQQVNFVNIAVLKSANTATPIEELFTTKFARQYGKALSQLFGQGYKKGFTGKGEIALACLSSGISLNQSDDEDMGGDILLGSSPIEVKSHQGRLFGKGITSYTNTEKFLQKTLKGRTGLNLSVDDVARLSPEGDDDTEGKRKSGGKSNFDAWTGQSQKWWDTFMKSVIADRYGNDWTNFSQALSRRVGTGDAFKKAWLKIQFEYYKGISNHKAILLVGTQTFVMATKSEHLEPHILSYSGVYMPGVGEPREANIQLKIQ
jgi:hypothetical protein